MKKDSIRDYTTNAFVLYAKLGKPSEDELKNRIYKEELLKHNEPQKALKAAERAVNQNIALLNDISAVNKTLELFKACGKNDIVKAIEKVYFAYPEKTLHLNDISSRVIKLSLEMPASESTIFKWLRQARLLLADIRGLNTQQSLQ